MIFFFATIHLEVWIQRHALTSIDIRYMETGGRFETTWINSKIYGRAMELRR
jgi:hypothetical protein